MGASSTYDSPPHWPPYFDGGVEDWGAPDGTPLLRDTQAKAHLGLAPYPRAAQTFYKRTVARLAGTYPGTLTPYTYTYNDPTGATGTFDLQYSLTMYFNRADVAKNTYPNGKWSLESAPTTDAGDAIEIVPVPETDGEDHFDRIVRSFTRPGLYKFKFDLGLAVGESLTPAEALKRTCHVYILLPHAAGGITDWIAQEASLIATPTDGTADKWQRELLNSDAYLQEWKDATIQQRWDPEGGASLFFGAEAYILRAAHSLFLGFDYLGLANAGGVSGTPRYSYTNENKDPGHAFIPRSLEPDYVSIKGIVIMRYQVTNLMLAVFWRSLGLPEQGLLGVGNLFDWKYKGRLTDQSCVIATMMGFKLADAVRVGKHNQQWLLDNVLTVNNVGGLPTQDTSTGLNDVNLWPVPGIEALPNQDEWVSDYTNTRIGYERPIAAFALAEDADF